MLAVLLIVLNPVIYGLIAQTSRQSARRHGVGPLTASGGSFFDQAVKRFLPSKKEEEPKSEDDEMLEYLDSKPWRANKIKTLNVTYRPVKESWRERYRKPEDETIYLYSIPQFKPITERTRVDEIWNWPWMWSKTKAERLAYIHKLFYADCEAMTTQEHIEMDAFFSEFDMPSRWGLLRMKEFDVLNAFALNIAFWTDFNGIKPTDLGLRPDGTVRTCPVQFHQCISSSNRPEDVDHYAPPFKWDRAKSPDQAYEEVKNVYTGYPKRGLSWSSGWIDRGGWKPQQFGGPYFYAQAESLAFHYTDDIELVLDVENREVQYRSSTRLGQVDWDVERLRYNQFVKMLQAKGGWEVKPLPRLNWITRTPYRWTELLIDHAQTSTSRVLDNTIASIPGAAKIGEDASSAASKAWAEMAAFVQPYVQPALEAASYLGEQAQIEPKVQEIVRELNEWGFKLKSAIPIDESEVNGYVQRIQQLLSPAITSEENKNLPVAAPTLPTSSSTTTSTSKSTSTTPSILFELKQQPGEAEEIAEEAAGSSSAQIIVIEEEANLVEDILDEQEAFAILPKSEPTFMSTKEKRLAQEQFLQVKKQFQSLR